MRYLPVLFLVTIALFFVRCKSDSNTAGAEDILTGKSVSLTVTAGWEADDRFTISQPSNIISQNGYSYVFYVKEPVNSPLAGSGYGGTIHYAFSRDQGHTWSDQGLLINTGMPDQFDGAGVSKPAVIKVTDNDFFYLYYVGVTSGFTGQDGSPANRTSIGISKLIFNEDGPIRLAIKLNSGKPVLEPSKESGRFDAFKVDDPNPINMNGQIWLYYSGMDKFGGTLRTGLAVSANINESHIKQNNSRAVLDGVPTLFQKHNVGVLAIFTDTQNAWIAPDGLKFSKLKEKFPSQVKFARGNGDVSQLSWGLAAPDSGQPGFSRWELK